MKRPPDDDRAAQHSWTFGPAPRRSSYKPRLLPQWLEAAIAVVGLLLIIGVLGFLAIYGYAVQQAMQP